MASRLLGRRKPALENQLAAADIRFLNITRLQRPFIAYIYYASPRYTIFKPGDSGYCSCLRVFVLVLPSIKEYTKPPVKTVFTSRRQGLRFKFVFDWTAAIKKNRLGTSCEANYNLITHGKSDIDCVNCPTKIFSVPIRDQ